MADMCCVKFDKIKDIQTLGKRYGHNHRYNKSYRNVDDSLTGTNKYMNNWGGKVKTPMQIYKENKKLHEEKTGKKLRKDAVIAVETLFSAPRDVMESAEKREKWENSAREFLREFFPDCVCELYFHYDEPNKSTHAHALVMMGDNGVFNCKGYLNHKTGYAQDLFSKICKRNGLELERGVSKEVSKRKGKSLEETDRDLQLFDYYKTYHEEMERALAFTTDLALLQKSKEITRSFYDKQKSKEEINKEVDEVQII